ncbi:MAG: response regulator transcription factor [Anaerolineales bacterium]
MKSVDPTPLPDPPKTEKIRILLVDDHAVVRQGLRTFIELQDDLEVVGEGCNGGEAVDLAARYQPDVILLDLVMPGMDGVEAIGKILACSPFSRVIILTSFGGDDKIFPAIRAGAQGYLLKDIQPGELIQAVRGMHQGKTPLHPDVAKRLVSAVAGNASAMQAPAISLPEDLRGLTEREREVLGLIARGLNNREIAEKMVVSEATVKTHVSNLLDKLGLQDRTRAAIWALKHGIGSED